MRAMKQCSRPCWRYSEIWTRNFISPSSLRIRRIPSAVTACMPSGLLMRAKSSAPCAVPIFSSAAAAACCRMLRAAAACITIWRSSSSRFSLAGASCSMHRASALLRGGLPAAACAGWATASRSSPCATRARWQNSAASASRARRWSAPQIPCSGSAPSAARPGAPSSRSTARTGQRLAGLAALQGDPCRDQRRHRPRAGCARRLSPYAVPRGCTDGRDCRCMDA